MRHLGILWIAALVVALPFLLREPAEELAWREGDPVLFVISPHNEAIRREFGRAFSAWHAERYGPPVKVEWLAVGGTSEIARYLNAQFVSAARAWWRAPGRPWPPGAAEALHDRRFDPRRPPEVPREEGETGAAHEARRAAAAQTWEELAALHTAFRATDDPAAFTARIDVFFGGGQYDHAKAFGQGLTVPPWPPGDPPAGLLAAEDGTPLLPEAVGGETWRGPGYFGAAVSTFGICYNPDRLRDLGVPHPPAAWADLAAPAYLGQLGVADPTKSGSIAKAFEMIVHQQCGNAVARAGFAAADVERFEAAFAAARLPPGELPAGVPPAYQEAVERGWIDGLNLIRLIGANARYFTDGASQVPIDVSAGRAAAGLAIDFYARYQAECSRAPDGSERMYYVTPPGGSSVSADPVSLLRGAEHRELGVRFLRFVLGEEGQRLWTYRPGEPGGPHTFALRRLPIRRDFYPSEDPAMQARHEEHARHAADPLGAPDVNPYALAARFTYRPRWTAAHFGIHRDIVKAMCLDAFEELRAAWAAIILRGGPGANPEAMAALLALPGGDDALTWRTALQIPRERDRLAYLRDWTRYFRAQYRRAEALASGGR